MIRIGVICPSEIAYRRFAPAIQLLSDRIRFEAIAIATPEEWFGNLSEITNDAIIAQQTNERNKACTFVETYGGKIILGYEQLIMSEDIDAIYIPLPPALHHKWAKFALENGKHVFVEKPCTTNLRDTDELIELATKKSLALHENYMFIYHSQLDALRSLVDTGEIGDVRLYRITFGFPKRPLNDFRYNKILGGGALLDAGGYCLKYADYLLGYNGRIMTACMNKIDGYSVDMYGSATLSNDRGLVVQIAFGMDNDYRCDIEIWGSKGTVTSNRILTAPAGFKPYYTIKSNKEHEVKELPIDDTFVKSIERFLGCIQDTGVRHEEYSLLHRQALLVDSFKKLCNNN